MDELSLFTGGGGGILGTTLLGFRHIGYVEWNDYCQRLLRQRIEDGILDTAPIFCDVRAFISEGYAASYTEMVDLLTAGFPCQPFSTAGRGKAADDKRNMWPATADVIRIIKPRRVLLENVPGIRAYLPVVIRDLRRLGYSVRRPLQLGADDCGAPHKRKRVWIMADAQGCGNNRNTGELSEAHERKAEKRPEKRHVLPIDATWWEMEPGLGRVVDGVAYDMDRTCAIGNGQVPAVVATAYRILAQEDL